MKYGDRRNVQRFFRTLSDRENPKSKPAPINPPKGVIPTLAALTRRARDLASSVSGQVDALQTSPLVQEIIRGAPRKIPIRRVPALPSLAQGRLSVG
jgi:hypothetical protein